MNPKALKNGNGGFTLLEVLVAVFVLAIVALPLLNLFVFNTALVRRAADMQDTTYAAQAVMEDMEPLGYAELYALAPAPGTRGDYRIRSVEDASTVTLARTVSIDRIPWGPFDGLVPGQACYAHLIVNGPAATLTCPDGRTYAGLSYSSGISVTASSVTAGGSTFSLNKPAGAGLILIINAGAQPISSLSIALPADGSVTYVLYALSPGEQNISVSNGAAASKEYRKYNSSGDPPPSYMLVNAVCRVYRPDGSVESLAQGTLEVSLP